MWAPSVGFLTKLAHAGPISFRALRNFFRQTGAAPPNFYRPRYAYACCKELKKLNLWKKPYYKKQPKEELKKTQNLDEKLAKGSPRVVLEKIDLEKIPYSTHIEPKYKPDEKLLKLKPVVKINKLNLRKNPYNKKRSKEELKKTQNLDEKLAKGSPRVVLEKLDFKKNLYSTHIEPKYKPDEKLLKLRPIIKLKRLNLRNKKQSKEEPKKTSVDVKKLLSSQVKLEKLTINSKSFYQKFPKLTIRKL